MMKSFWIAACLLLLGGNLTAQTADARLEQFFRQHLDAWFKLRPVSASELGDHRFDAQLDDLTPTARSRWLEHTRKTLAELPQQVNRAELSRAGQIDFDIFEQELRKGLWLAENFDSFANDPRVYSGYISGNIFDLLAQSSLPREVNVSNAIARIRQVPNVLAAARQNLKNPPRVYVETAIKQNLGSIGFYEKGISAAGVGTVREARVGSKATVVLQAAANEILPALRDYQKFLETDLLPRATGEWRIGPEKFARKLELELDAGMTADEVYASAKSEFHRVRNDLYVVARQLWSKYFPREPLPPDDETGRATTIRRVLHQVAQQHSDSKSIVRDVRRGVADIKKFIAQNNILTLPDPDQCQIIEMPEFARGNSTAYMSSPPPLDTNATGFYAVSPPPADWDAARVKSYFEEYNDYMIQILTIHEAYPGHYVQLEYANRNPSLIRKVLGSGAFVEGWAVYTEQMMLDQGYGKGDLALRTQQLKFYLRAVCNTILDHRMHCENLTDEDAMDLLVNQAFQSEGEAKLKVIRAKQSSVQLSTYFTGRMAHYRLRQEISRALGEKFSLGRYHEAVLSHGSIPMKFLPELVREQLLPKTP